MFRNITVNGFDLEVAKVRFGDNGFVVSGLTEDGYAIEQEFNFADGAEISFSAQKVQEVAPVKKQRKARKPKNVNPDEQPELAATPAVESVEVPTDEEYLTLTQNRGRGRPSREVAAKIAAYKAAHDE